MSEKAAGGLPSPPTLRRLEPRAATRVSMMEDDYVCEYDSTWDTESDGEEQQTAGRPARRQDKNKPWALPWPHTSRNMRAAKDMQNYRRGYPNLTDDECSEDKMNNLKFYLNQFPSAPDEVYIESFHKEWKTDYKKLERVHSYIQWLFPLREPGVNYMASELTKKEIEAFKKSDEAKGRLVESYELMLGFYGIQLVNRETGEVKRADNWKERFGNLERNMHNNLRITRILKSLGVLGFDHYQAPLVRFFLEETLVKKSLGSIKRSVLDYFLFAVLDKPKRQELVRFAYLHFEPKDKFVWCPRKIVKQFKKPEKRPDPVGNGDGKEDHSSRGKGKDGEAAGGAQKEEAPARADNAAEAHKKSDKTAGGDKVRPSGAVSESKPEAGTVENGTAEVILVDNGNGDTVVNEDAANDDDDEDDGDDEEEEEGEEEEDDDDEMDQSVSPVRTNVHPECRDAREQDMAQETVGTKGSERKTKEEREDAKVVRSGTLATDSANGQTEEKAVPSAIPMHTSPSAGPKTKPEGPSKYSPSRPSGREEKIPRTDFVTEGEKTKASSGSLPGVDKHSDEQTNGRGCEAMDVESNQPTSGQDENS
ncbi:Opioid growth factor receptor [Merluccius polli]|uniref:Opioid growth factor receptor n=1 Tax=Merluccius polli TaxID=89951 RepID=A0AA47MVQ0_MERPO|nr:Opioid growth factor receptor [Merluccius polli]